MKKILLLCLFFCGTVTFVWSQSEVDPRIMEVYGSYVNEMTTEQLQWQQNILQRCEVVQQPATASDTFLLLSGVALIEKFGVLDPSIPADPQQLNPLKYAIKFNNRDKDLKYRIDGTDYLLVVHQLD